MPTGSSRAATPTAQAGRRLGVRGSAARRTPPSRASCGNATRPERLRPSLTRRWAVGRTRRAAVDPDDERVYLTQDHPRDSSTGSPRLRIRICRAGPSTPASSPTTARSPGARCADPSGATAPTRTQVPGARVFPGNEGIWYHDGWIYFTSKYDHSVHGIDLRAQTYTLIWKGDPDGLGVEGAVLSGVDNITVDAGSRRPDRGRGRRKPGARPHHARGQVAPFLRIAPAGHEASEVTGPVFNPRRDRLYFSSQRGPTPSSWGQVVDGMDPAVFQGGITYEISGPFRGAVVDEPESTTTVPTTAAVVDTTSAVPPRRWRRSSPRPRRHRRRRRRPTSRPTIPTAARHPPCRSASGSASSRSPRSAVPSPFGAAADPRTTETFSCGQRISDQRLVEHRPGLGPDLLGVTLG